MAMEGHYLWRMRNAAILLTALTGHLYAQDCSLPYNQPLFDTQVEQGIWYGNATRYDGGTDSLRFNLYKPVGDGQTERPIVVAIHGGGFTEGHRNDLNGYCNTLASMGWACATISYRLGFHGSWLFAPPYANDVYELPRAIHRAQQDAKGAVRFLKGRHEQDSTSTSVVFLTGYSAGAITALHTAYTDQESERPAAAAAIGDVQHFLNLYPRPDLGDIDGDLNQNGFDATVLGVNNMYGAVLDTSMVDGTDRPALFSYHQTDDPVVPCWVNRPYWGIGLGIPDAHPYLFGSCAIDTRVQHIGAPPGHYQFQLHQGNAHEVHDPAGVMQASLAWMRGLFCDVQTRIPDNGPPGSLHLHPNPATTVVQVLDPAMGERTRYELYNALGARVTDGTMKNGRIAVAELAPGSYVLRTSAGKDVRYGRFMKE
jgi:hypothetical protein